MSPRERNLLILLASMAFLAVNLLGYKVWYEPQMKKMAAARATAEREADFNELEASSSESLQGERDWLTRSEPEPMSESEAMAKIQQLTDGEATRAGLEIKAKGKFGDKLVDSALNYHRVRYELQVVGPESSVYNWISRLHNPNEFRAVTFMDLRPLRDDATKADCIVYLDQWFVPAP